MQPLSESDISSMYGIDLNDVTAFAGEIDSTGLRTDEFLIIEAKNNESADRILTKMKARQTQRMNEAKNYNPEGYATVQKSPVAKKGNYVYLFFSEDADTMVNILNENVKEIKRDVQVVFSEHLFFIFEKICLLNFLVIPNLLLYPKKLQNG